MQIVDTNNGLAIGQRMLPFQVFPDHRTQNRGAPEAAAHPNLDGYLVIGIKVELHADVVCLYNGAVLFGARNRNLELTWKQREFRVESAPLAQDFSHGAWVNHFIRSNARKLIGGDVADAVAGGLNRVHLYSGKLGQHFRHIFQFWPVQLQILPCAEMAIAAVICLLYTSPSP